MNTAVASETAAQTETTARKRGCFFFIKRGLLVLVILLVALPITGFVYESIMSAGDAQRYPPPGQIVSVGDHQLHIQCTGEGSPTVVLESGSNSFSVDWYLEQPEIAQFTRVCSYDRAGYAWSEPGPEPRSPQQIAVELHTLLANAGIDGPYVLVGQSNGGKYVRMFAIEYPQDVAGMVLVDARHESQEPVRTPEEFAKDMEAYKASLGLYTTLRQIGVARAFGSFLVASLNPPFASLPAETRTLIGVFAGRQNTLDAMVAEGAGGMMNDAQLSANKLPDGIPLIVLVADESITLVPSWMDSQQMLAALSSNSRLVIVDNTDHMIQLTQPAAVAENIRLVVEAVRTGQPLAQ